MVKIKIFDFEASDSRKTGVLSLGMPGGRGHPHILADQLDNPISTRGVRLCPPNNTGTPGFSDLPTALKDTL